MTPIEKFALRFPEDVLNVEEAFLDAVDYASKEMTPEERRILIAELRELSNMLAPDRGKRLDLIGWTFFIDDEQEESALFGELAMTLAKSASEFVQAGP